MSIPMISSLRGLVKNMELEFKWQERKKNPSMAKTGFMSEIERLNEQAEAHRKHMTILNIEGKLKSGQRLSAAEMDFLKENAPQLYDKAVAVQKEREEYKRELERCKTKEDVQELNMQKLARLDAEVKAVTRSGMSAGAKLEAVVLIGMRAAAIMNEHTEFVNSSDYGRLPTREELEEDKKTKESKSAEDEDFWKTDPPKQEEVDFNGEKPELPENEELPEVDEPADVGETEIDVNLPGDGSEIFTQIMEVVNSKPSGTSGAGIYTSGGKIEQGTETNARKGKKL